MGQSKQSKCRPVQAIKNVWVSLCIVFSRGHCRQYSWKLFPLDGGLCFQTNTEFPVRCEKWSISIYVTCLSRTNQMPFSPCSRSGTHSSTSNLTSSKSCSHSSHSLRSTPPCPECPSWFDPYATSLFSSLIDGSSKFSLHITESSYSIPTSYCVYALLRPFAVSIGKSSQDCSITNHWFYLMKSICPVLSWLWPEGTSSFFFQSLTSPGILPDLRISTDCGLPPLSLCFSGYVLYLPLRLAWISTNFSAQSFNQGWWQIYSDSINYFTFFQLHVYLSYDALCFCLIILSRWT